MNRIVRVYGICDDWQVEFQHVEEHLWRCQVPPDITDGQYACQFYAVDEEGDIGYWCGVLYMSSGEVCIKLDEDPVYFSLVHETLFFDVEDDDLSFDTVKDPVTFSIVDESLIFSVVKECCCNG